MGVMVSCDNFVMIDIVFDCLFFSVVMLVNLV